MVGQVVGPVIGKVAQKAAKKGIEKIFQQLLKNQIQKEGIASLPKRTEKALNFDYFKKLEPSLEPIKDQKRFDKIVNNYGTLLSETGGKMPVGELTKSKYEISGKQIARDQKTFDELYQSSIKGEEPYDTIIRLKYKLGEIGLQHGRRANDFNDLYVRGAKSKLNPNQQDKLKEIQSGHQSKIGRARADVDVRLKKLIDINEEYKGDILPKLVDYEKNKIKQSRWLFGERMGQPAGVSGIGPEEFSMKGNLINAGIKAGNKKVGDFEWIAKNDPVQFFNVMGPKGGTKTKLVANAPAEYREMALTSLVDGFMKYLKRNEFRGSTMTPWDVKKDFRFLPGRLNNFSQVVDLKKVANTAYERNMAYFEKNFPGLSVPIKRSVIKGKGLQVTKNFRESLDEKFNLSDAESKSVFTKIRTFGPEYEAIEVLKRSQPRETMTLDDVLSWRNVKGKVTHRPIKMEHEGTIYTFSELVPGVKSKTNKNVKSISEFPGFKRFSLENKTRGDENYKWVTQAVPELDNKTFSEATVDIVNAIDPGFGRAGTVGRSSVTGLHFHHPERVKNVKDVLGSKRVLIPGNFNRMALALERSLESGLITMDDLKPYNNLLSKFGMNIEFNGIKLGSSELLRVEPLEQINMIKKSIIEMHNSLRRGEINPDIESMKNLINMIKNVSPTGNIYKRGGLINDPLTATMNSGGYVDYGEMKDVAPLLDPGERQHLQLGGKIAEKIAKEAAKAGVKYVKKQVLPKVIGHVEKIVPKLTATKEALKKTISEWAVFDRKGNTIKDFKTQTEADKWLYNKKETVPEKEYYESTIDYTVGKIPKPEVKTAAVTEKKPAIVWKTPTVIKNAPIEIGQGKQWLGFLKKSVSPKELEDTSIGPYLEFHVPNERISKQQLLEAFNEVSPKFDVIPLGDRNTKQMVSKITEKFNNIRERMEGFSKQDKKALNVFEGAFTKLGQAEQIAGPLKEKDATYNLIGNEINRVMKQLYDIDNAVMNVGALRDPRIPGPIRSIFGDLQELLKIRGAKHAFESSPKHAGQQVLPGGINYREYLFKSSPGSLRLNEPIYKPGHSFDLSGKMAEGTFVHTRISDRTDNFGRKLLFIEEIQSDMHQKIQAALRAGEGGGYATRQDKIAGIEPVVREMEKVQMQIDHVLAKNPKDAKLPELYSKREALAEEIYVKKAKIGEVSQSGTPEGPFQRSEDYGSFVAKYLLRLAKEGNYDGVAVSTGAIKNRLKSESRGNLMDEEATGHYGFYDAIMQNALKKIAKKGNLDYTYTVINDGKVNWGNVPVLLLKAGDKVLEGLPAFREGGLVRENFVDVVPLL